MINIFKQELGEIHSFFLGIYTSRFSSVRA